MTFGEWQQLQPEAAAREVLRRAREHLSGTQGRAAIAALLGEEALAAAFGAVPQGSALRGIPYLIKDLFDVAGLPTLAGSSFLPEVRPEAGRTAAIAYVHDMVGAGAEPAARPDDPAAAARSTPANR